MKAFGLFVLVFALAATASAELDTLWTRQIELGVNGFEFEAATVLANGETMAAATGSQVGTVALWRFGLDGSTLWSGEFSVSLSYSTILSMDQLSNGEIMIAVAYWSNADSSSRIHVRTMNNVGETIHEREYPYYVTDTDVELIALRDGGAAFVFVRNVANQFNRATLMRLNSNCDTLFTRDIELPGQIESYGRGAAEFNNGDLLLCGSYAINNATTQAFVMRTTWDGTPIWTRSYESGTDYGLNASCVDIDGAQNIVVGGYSGFIFWLSYSWAVGLTPDGNPRWTLSGMDESYTAVSGIRAMRGGGAMLFGTIYADFGFDFISINVVNEQGVGNPTSEYSCQGCRMHSANPSRIRGAVAFGRVTDAAWANYGFIMRFPPGTSVTGIVRTADTNEPIVGARVELVESGDYSFTDAQGIYNFGVSMTEGTLRVSDPCITPVEQHVALNEGEDNTFNFTTGFPELENPVSSVNMIVTYGMWEHDTLTVFNNGTGALPFSVEALELNPTYDWLAVSPVNGEIPVQGSAQIIVSVLADAGHPEADLAGVVRIHSNSCPDTVSDIGVFALALDSPERPHPVTSFALYPAYPNPFNASTRVAFDLPQPARVVANLYDITGRQVAQLANEAYPAGSFVLNFSAPDLATGMYLLRLSAGESVATQKLVLLK